jgi:hypothetical protein
MSAKRILLAIVLTVTISFCLVPMTSQANVAPADRAAQGTPCAQHTGANAAPISPRPECIPCSPKNPCKNPLTVCSYSGSSTHGCCLGYAGLN